MVFVALISRTSFALGALALLYCSASLSEVTNSLTLDDALRIAEERSQELVADDATASAAREMAAAADQAPDAILKAGINNLPIDGRDAYSLTNDFMTMRSPSSSIWRCSAASALPRRPVAWCRLMSSA